MPQSDDFEARLNESDTHIAEFDEFSFSLLQKIQRFLHDNAAMVPVIILVMSIIAFGFFAGGRFFLSHQHSPFFAQASGDGCEFLAFFAQS